MNKLTSWIPGLQLFGKYEKSWLPKDLAAGLSVAAIALPVGIAYSDLAGLPPVTGLYSCILPMVAYALFGTSRQMIVGPDSATCILIASVLAPLAATGSEEYQLLSVMLAVTVGLLCVAAGIMKLGFIARFLSKPILTGYINGLALSIIAGQLGKFFGFKIESGGFFKVIYGFFSGIEKTHIATLLIAVSTFIFIRIFKKYFRKIPAPLLAVIGGICAVIFFGLDSSGVQIVGSVPSGFPGLIIPEIELGNVGTLVSSSLGIVLISYCSAMLTDKSFAVKNGYKIDPDREFIALGFSNIFSGLSQGFVVSGADSRTAVNDSMGGKTQLVSVFGAATILAVVLFFTDYLTYLPVATLSAVIISASIGLFNFTYLKKIYLVSRTEFFLAVVTSLSVITIGVIPAVLLAIGLTFIELIKKTSKPHSIILGKVEGMKSYQDVNEFENAERIPEILILRFEGPLLFFNADYFRDHIIQETSDSQIKFLILDTSSMVRIDISGADILGEMIDELSARGVEVKFARMKPRVRNLLERSGIIDASDSNVLFESVNESVEFCKGRLNL